MDWIQSVQRALNYIEANMFVNGLDNETIAKQAYSSNANFQRIFSIVTGVTIADKMIPNLPLIANSWQGTGQRKT